MSRWMLNPAVIYKRIFKYAVIDMIWDMLILYVWKRFQVIVGKRKADEWE